MHIVCDELNENDHRAFDPSDATLWIDLTAAAPLESCEIREITKWSGAVCKTVSILGMTDGCMGDPWLGYITLKTSAGDFDISVSDGIKIGVTFPQLVTPCVEARFKYHNRNWMHTTL